MEGQELQGDDTEDSLQTVHSVRQLDGVVGHLTDLRVVLATKDDGPTLMERVTSKNISQLGKGSGVFPSACRSVRGTYRSSGDLLQSILALGVAGVSHDDHDHRHVFVYKCQRAVLQLPGQDALRVHVRDLLDFLHWSEMNKTSLTSFWMMT